jgi:hypothetical protein
MENAEPKVSVQDWKLDAETIARLMDTASRLRKVRQAQRRFLRRWAEERADEWSRLLTQPRFASNRLLDE